MMLLFSQMIGALVLQIAGRLDQLQMEARILLQMQLPPLWALPSPPTGGRPAAQTDPRRNLHPESKIEKERKQHGAR
jgi:hypothetical protein